VNKLERAVKAEYDKEGWTALRDGWPDFLFVRKVDGKLQIRAVEVKGRKDSVRSNQREVIDALAAFIQVRLAVEGPGFGTTHNVDGCEFHELLQRSKHLDYLENEDKMCREAKEGLTDHAKKNR
jgi:hypothetical protein